MTTEHPVTHQSTVWPLLESGWHGSGYDGYSHALAGHSSVCDISSEHSPAFSVHSLAPHTILTVSATLSSPSYLCFGSSFPNFKDLKTPNWFVFHVFYRMKWSVYKRNLPLPANVILNPEFCLLVSLLGILMFSSNQEILNACSVPGIALMDSSIFLRNSGTTGHRTQWLGAMAEGLSRQRAQIVGPQGNPFATCFGLIWHMEGQVSHWSVYISTFKRENKQVF